ncbi:O-antigen ligase family protein [Cupriavidus basilensis]
MLLAIYAREGMSKTWSAYRNLLYPLGLAILALVIVCLASKLYFGVPWNVIDNPSRILLALLTFLVVLRSALDPRAIWRGITIALVASLVVVTFQYVALGDSRPAAWTQAIAFGNMVAALGLVGFVRPGTSRRTHALAWTNLALGAVILVLNGTRGATLAMLLTALPLLFVRYRGLSLAKFCTAMGLVAVLGTGLYMIPGSPVANRINEVLHEIERFKDGDTENVRRFAAESMAARHGLYPFASLDGSGRRTICPHSAVVLVLPGGGRLDCVRARACTQRDVLEATATMGFPGTLAVLGLFLVPGAMFLRLLRQCCRNANALGVSLSSAGLGVVMASLIGGLTQVTMAHQANIVFYAGVIGLLLGLAAVQAKYPRTDGVEKP